MSLVIAVEVDRRSQEEVEAVEIALIQRTIDQIREKITMKKINTKLTIAV
jgi:hypothetical protein